MIKLKIHVFVVHVHVIAADHASFTAMPSLCQLITDKKLIADLVNVYIIIISFDDTKESHYSQFGVVAYSSMFQ